jgi:CRP-like cAMP-binding protein
MERIEQLRQFRILHDFDVRQLDAIGHISRLETFEKGDQLTSEGSRADRLCLLLKGKAFVRVRDPQGRQVLIDEIWPGDVLGWSAAIDPFIYTASAWAAEASEALVVSGPKLRELIACDEQFGYQMTKGIGDVISRRFGRAVGARGDLRAKDVRAFDGQERVIWDEGGLQLTTQAVLIDMATDAPEVIPLESIEGVDVVDGQVVFRMHSGDVWSPPLESAGQLAALARDEMVRTRYAQRRKDYYLD